MKKEKILVVEDEMIVAMDIERGLKGLGYEVPAVVDNGEEAIKASEEHKPDLVLMDIQIKGDMDGIETAQVIWEKFRIPVIFLTAYADDKTLEKAKRTEPFGYVLKPFEEKELHTTIEVVLKKHRTIQARETLSKEALEASEERFRLLVESIQDYAIFMLDPQGYVESWNIGAERITGFKTSEIIGMHFSVFYSKDDLSRNHHELVLDEALNNGRFQEEGWRIKKDGSRFWAHVTITALYDKYNNHRGFAKISRDVTQLHASQRALKKTQDLLQSIIDFAPIVIYVKDIEGRYILANRSFSEVVGVPKEKIIGKTDHDLFAPDLVDKFRSNDSWILKENKELEIEEIVPHKGKLNTYFSIKFPLNDSKGKPYAVCGISSNITERKEEEARKIELLQELKEAVKARDEFLSIASHELKTPVTSLKIQTQFQARLQKKNVPEAFSREKIEENTKKTEKLIYRIERLIDDMLDISRIRTGELTINKETANLSQIAREVIDRMQETFLNTSGEEIRFQGPEEAFGVFDPMRIEQVINNLLQNALKYGLAKKVKVHIEDKSEFLFLSVSDKGMGISKEMCGKIFERYERAVSANEVSGLGLGLYISHHIIKTHQGRIWVSSKLGEGSTFYVEIPKSNA